MTRSDYRAARLAMIDGQLRTNTVHDDRVLDAFDAVPRERFVPEPLRGVAYIDEDLPLGNGRWLIEPMVLARLIQLAAIAPADTVLVIGDPSGYAAAVIAWLARRVVMVESESGAIATARQRLADLGCANVEVVQGPLEEGYAAGAPYSAIVLAGAAADVPHVLRTQLAEGGHIVGVIRKPGAPMGEAEVMTRVGAALSRRPVFDAGTPYLPGFQPAPSFAF
ncbi:MAG: protein-L-isoaspartate O-methyltransferase [Alphaproteobacteria bacterium]|nr:protein-L-isoaspartate O-methyltransferase [Alphaproteobacteria bacterium]